ncbi:STAS domain-containing protein [Geminocystis sp. NIES-3709]|uniref:STAS domain-containing protein n=1 Tax=Geminocystis sp. NIES-3709 TaxID=1617448 RepID=UPI0005FC5712|nr:STAS domain-containing protein [Geminocystis sp. NIES-3709]BAQ64635.1 anti-sigma F factor antagonist SpoIIAA-2 [Geminocystis sp. NIES-3709]
MTLEIQSKLTEPTTICIILNGELDAVTTPQLDEFITTKVKTNIKNLIFDLQTLNFVSSAGLRIFAKARKMMKSREGKIYFINPTPQVKKVFDIVKVVPISDVFQSVEELDSYLRKIQSKTTD